MGIRDCNWVEYIARMEKIVCSFPSLSLFLAVDEKVGLLNEWMCSVNDDILKNLE